MIQLTDHWSHSSHMFHTFTSHKFLDVSVGYSLQVEVTPSLRILLYSSFVSLCIFGVCLQFSESCLIAGLTLYLILNVLCGWLCNIRNLTFFTNSIKSIQKGANLLIGGVCLMLLPFMPRFITFQRILLMTISVCSISFKR